MGSPGGPISRATIGQLAKKVRQYALRAGGESAHSRRPSQPPACGPRTLGSRLGQVSPWPGKTGDATCKLLLYGYLRQFAKKEHPRCVGRGARGWEASPGCNDAHSAPKRATGLGAMGNALKTIFRSNPTERARQIKSTNFSNIAITSPRRLSDEPVSELRFKGR